MKKGDELLVTSGSNFQGEKVTVTQSDESLPEVQSVGDFLVLKLAGHI
jgi:hypothetical protein